MIIEIDDAISGKERRNLLEVLSLQYALRISKGVKCHAAKWLGISIRNLRNKMKKYPRLENSCIPTVDMLTEKQHCMFNEYWEDVVIKKPGYTYANAKDKLKIREKIIAEFIGGKVYETTDE